MVRSTKSVFILIAAICILSTLVLAACGGTATTETTAAAGGSGTTQPAGTTTTAAGAELTQVVVGALPFLDYQAFYAASDLGLDKEQGLELKFQSFPLEPNEILAVARGDVQVGQGAIGSLIPQIPQRDDLRVFLSTAQFKGFAFVGRAGEFKTFDEFMTELNDSAKAREATVAQFKGKSIVTIESSFGATIVASLQEAGLTKDDVKILNFNDSPAAAVAYIRGEGDVFMGGLPETTKLLKESDDKYNVVIGAEDMGAPGLWYSNAFTTEKYLKENRETLVKLTAVYYRTMRYLKEQPDKVLQVMVDNLNEQGASGTTVEDAKGLIPEFVYFGTAEETKALTYDPKSDGYWKKLTDYLIPENEKQGKIPAGSVKAETLVVQEDIFNEFMANTELVNWVNSPLK